QLRAYQAIDGLIASDDGTKEDEGDDDYSRQVFGPAITVGEAPRPRPSRQQESHPERQSGGRIAKVVDGVREQRDTAREPDYEHLYQGGDTKADKGPFDRPNTALGGRDAGVYDAVRMAVVMGVVVWSHIKNSFATVTIVGSISTRFARRPSTLIEFHSSRMRSAVRQSFAPDIQTAPC